MDAARYAAMSDPYRNVNFTRRWAEPPDQKHERRPVGTGAAHREAAYQDEKRMQDIEADPIAQAALRLALKWGLA